MRILDRIVLLGEPRVKKNTSVKYGVRSKPYQKWHNAALIQMIGKQPLTGPWPVLLHVHFYMKTRRKFDCSNMVEGCQDVLQETGVIPNDDYMHIRPVFHGDFGGVTVDPGNPRTVLTITTVD